MIRQNKDGRPIYSDKKWQQLMQIGEILERLRYLESNKKPNLFYLQIDNGIIFADLRGTIIVPIWDDLRPLVYKSKDLSFESFFKKIIRLKRAGCDPRGSFYDMYEPGGWGFLLEEGEIPSGYCKMCGKDIMNIINWTILLEEDYSQFLTGIDLYLELNYCVVCRKIEYSKKQFRHENLKDQGLCELCERNKAVLEHHITYYPPKIISICRSCHGKIHKFGRNFPNPLWKEKNSLDNKTQEEPPQ